MDSKALTNWVMSMAFVAGISLPLVTMWSGNGSNSEQRNLASFPSTDLKSGSIYRFPAGFEAYVNDRFGFRNWLLDVQGKLSYELFHRSGSSRVIAGKQDWLFYTDDGSLQDMQRTDPFSAADLRNWKASVEQRGAWLSEKGIQYRLVVAPDKQTIYPEMLPARMFGAGPTRLEQLLAYMGPSPYVVDTHPALIERKPVAAGRLFFHTDTHWTSYGAYLGYRRLMDSLSGQVKANSMMLADSAFVTQHGGGPTDLSTMIRLPRAEANEGADISGRIDCLRQSQALPPLGIDVSRLQGYSATVCNGQKGTALVFHDSFMTAMSPYISSQFGRVVYVWARPDSDMLVRMVAQEKPDVVIEERVERYMRTPPLPDLDQVLARTDSAAARQYTSASGVQQEQSNALLNVGTRLVKNADGESFMLNGKLLARVSGKRDGGYLDEVRGEGRNYIFTGWAGLADEAKAARFVVLTAGDQVVYVAPVGGARPDVAVHYDEDALTTSGFTFAVPHDYIWATSGDIRMFAFNGAQVGELNVNPDLLGGVQQRDKFMAQQKKQLATQAASASAVQSSH